MGSFKPYFYLIDDNVEEWDSTKFEQRTFTKNINYNLSFQCDTLIVANNIDYFEDEEDEEGNAKLITNYSLSTPFTIDLNKSQSKDRHGASESTPLLQK